MLLRASSEKAGAEVDLVDLAAAVGRGAPEAIPHAQQLLRFAEAISRGSEDADEARAALAAALGPAAFCEAAAIVGIFNGLVRTADASGIPLDDGTRDHTVDVRADLGLDTYHGAANTDLDAASRTAPAGDVGKLFG